MVFDEFGRAVPNSRNNDSPGRNNNGGRDSDIHIRRSRSRSPPYNYNDSSMGIENMRYGDMGRTDNILYHGRSSRSRSPPVGGGGRRGGGYDDSAGHGRIMDYGDSDGYLHDRRGPSPSSPSRYPRGRSPPRRGRSRSYSNERYDHHHSKRSNSWGGGTPHRRRNRHPVEQYVDEPMLCYHLWKESITKNKENEPDVEAKKGENDEIKSNNMNDATTVDQSQTQQTVEGNDADADAAAAAAATDNPTIVEENQEEEDSKFREEYNDYRERYCLDFVRGFFNEHLDDEWFKLRYSPLHRKNNAIKLRERASTEASTIKEEIMKQFESSNGPSAKEMFIAEARLGTGKKPTGNNYQRNRGKRAFSMEEENNELRDEELEYRNPIPSSHLLSGHAHCALEIQGVPAHVSDGQISQAIAEHSSSPPLRICSTTVGIGRDAGSTRPSFCNSLTRTVWAIFINEEAKEEMIENLTKANFEANRINDRNRSMDADIIPTIEAKSSHSTLELDVDHSDPYSRTEIDADGSGGAPKAIHEPEDPNHPNYQPTKERSMSIPKVPLRKSTVYVQTESRTREPNISVLSAAVSSRERISRDKNAALMIARALDAAMSLQESIRLDNIVEILFSDKNDESEKVDEDILDVAIAYLRRVHLFSFYNGQAALCEGDVLSGFNPTGTIHLRLRDADSILQKALNEEAAKQDQLSTKIETSSNDDTTNGGEKVSQISQDLLVKRLDDSIAKALAESTAKIANFNIISEEVDAQASEIEKKENEAKAQWLTDHTLLDADGRARCSFHFCRKLFKDKLFLHKHLLKKHPEYLVAEEAKCHDTYMMKAWEEEEVRPIPQILVDCGDRFGFVPTIVAGAKCPIADDPSPELIRRDEEERKIMEEKNRERRERQKLLEQQRLESGTYGPGGRGPGNNNGRPPHVGGFVDVDDVKDEKIELSFENVEVSLPPPKKKRKKKKIL